VLSTGVGNLKRGVVLNCGSPV